MISPSISCVGLSGETSELVPAAAPSSTNVSSTSAFFTDLRGDLLVFSDLLGEADFSTTVVVGDLESLKNRLYKGIYMYFMEDLFIINIFHFCCIYLCVQTVDYICL